MKLMYVCIVCRTKVAFRATVRNTETGEYLGPVCGSNECNRVLEERLGLGR